jgi:hypothetical protein
MTRLLFVVAALELLIFAPKVTSSSKISGSARRADDNGPLETVVEQLSQQVTSLAATVTQQANAAAAADARIATLEAQVGELVL